MVDKLLIAILGPTASGKTAVSIELAKKYNTSIVSADSRQFYREMNIGTAKPGPEELASVPHYFINNLSIHDHYTAGMYEKDAIDLIGRLFHDNDVIILTGGSTLYIRALLHGIDEMPEVSAEAKKTVRQLYEERGIEGLQKELEKLDPQYVLKVDLSNYRRVIRALEVCVSSGLTYSSFLQNKAKARNFDILKLGVEIPREELYKRINTRCEMMLEAGLLDEVRSLISFQHLIPLHTVGYTEFFDHLNGITAYPEAVELFKQHTRNYAKRQMTWFRKEEGLQWLKPYDILNTTFERA